RPAGDGHLLHRRALPLHHLRRRGLPDLRRHVLLVPEGDGEALLRAARPDQLLDHLSRHQPALLPDAHRRARGDAAPQLHVPGRARLGHGQPRRDDRLLHHDGRDRRAAGQPARQLLPRPVGRARSVARRDARVDDPVAAAGLQLRGHPQGFERVRELGRRGPGGGPAQARRRDHGARRRARAAGELSCRRLVGRGREDAARLAVADPARARDVDRLHPFAPPPLDGDGVRAGGDRARAARLARRRAGGGRGVSGYVGELRRGGGPSVAFWGMAMLVASEATLFGTFIGSYYYLRFGTPHWPPSGTPEPRVVVPLILAGVLATTSLPMWLAAR